MNYFQYWLNIALWLAGIGHFCVLIASFQVPKQLGWKEDLPKLNPFNRKLFPVACGFVALTIIAFGTLTLLLHTEMMRGDRAAVFLAAFMAIFWTTRLMVDAFYYKHSDWPAGFRFVVGHFLLNALFVAIAATYWAVLALNFMK